MSLDRLRSAPGPEVAEYYRDAAVRARIIEYCGGTAMRPASAAFVVGFDPAGRPTPTWDDCPHEPADRLGAILERGLDVSRSLWDVEHLLFFLELDYLNIDAPAEPFSHPADTFLKLEPAYHATTQVLHDARLRARPIVSGRGYHFVGKVPLADPLIDALATLTPTAPPWLATHASRRPAAVAHTIDERHARAAEGLGRVLEFIAHRVLSRASPHSPIPIVFNGTVVGTGITGREAVSIDFSHAGDPLDVRHVRTAFSAYQWHRQRPDIFGRAVAEGVPPLGVVPRGRHSLMTLLLAGRDLAASREAAHGATAVLPNVAMGVSEMLAAYSASPLAVFHHEFDAGREEGWRPASAEVPGVPPCVAAAIAQANDLLLRPAHVQHVVRDLLSRGWPAARIASLVQSRYEADCDWGERWRRMDPATRAAFDVRVFAGLVATEADALVDFNCVSAQEKGLCPRSACQYDLRRDRDRLLTVRT